MRYVIRAATRADLRQMAGIAGPPVTRESLADVMDADRTDAAWHLIETEDGQVIGFQRIGRNPALPADTCEIATFLAARPLPPGAAARLFEATAAAARGLGYGWIAAHVAAANEAARTYYQAQGFRRQNQTLTHLNMLFDLD